MNFPLYIAHRYLKSASKSNAINIINGIASVGIVVGAMALFVVLSVFSGLINFSLSFSNSVDPDLKIQSIMGKSFFITENQENQIKKIKGIKYYSKIIEERALFTFNNKEQVANLKGVDTLFTNVTSIKSKVFDEVWMKPNTIQVVIGAGIAQKLSLGAFETISPFEVFMPKPGKGTINEDAFNKMQLYPIGIYAISEDLDSKYVFANIEVASELLGYKPNQISNLEIKLLPKVNENEVIKNLQNVFNHKITVKNRAQLNDTLYKMLNTENIAVYLIFTLVIIIALFNLIGSLIMMILDKKANLKTLYNLGTEINSLKKIFLFQGTLLSFLGGILGLFLGIVIVLVQQHFEIIMITDTLAYPVEFNFKNVIVVLITICTLGFLASLIASSQVSKKLLET